MNRKSIKKSGLILGIVMIISAYSFSQLTQYDFIFDFNNNVKQLNWIIDSTLKKFVMTEDEVFKAKDLSFKYIDSLSRIKDFRVKTVAVNLDNYYRQYVGYINREGKKIVIINCFCKHHFENDFDPRKLWLRTYDGGACYYHIEVNLTDKKCFGLYVHGSS